MASFGDFNRVNTNVLSLGARLSLNKINSELGDSSLKLSTGKRINSAEDDSAGYAIATKLNSRVKGLEQALQNVSDAKSMLDVVENAYNSIIDNLIKLKSLATQAASGTIATGSDEMALIASQMEALGDDINDIATSTTFNGIDLAGENASTLTIQVGELISDTFQIDNTEISMSKLFQHSISDDAGPLANSTFHASSGEVLGDTNTGGVTETFTHPNLDSEITPNIQGYHTYQAFSPSLSVNDPHFGNISGGKIWGFRGATIVVRGGERVESELNDNLLIDEERVNSSDMRSFMGHIDTAIDTMNSKVNELGINQRSLSSKEENLTQAITANSAAHSRIMDTDFAKEQSNSIRLQILQQTATAELSQANMGPQAVLGFLGQ